MWWCKLLVIISLCTAEDDREGLLVNTSQGPVRGYKEYDGVFVFYNIPYATVPTGEHKFKAPLPPPRWTHVFEAVEKGVICPQTISVPDISLKTQHIKEDCLITNIYVPDILETNLSVVLYIHGGGFQAGFGNYRKAKYLIRTRNMIVVTFNYRLGVQGFLCLGTKDIPGNAGMKDMVAMLKWLKNNIGYFGGNPDDITVSGYSTGATAADLLILSNSTHGLFKKVIIESGASTAEFAIQHNPLEHAQLYAKALKFNNVEDIYELEAFYKTMSFSKTFLNELYDPTIVFVPCIENNIGGEAFLTDSPINILKKGNHMKVPMLYGFTNMEGLMRAKFFESWKSAMNISFSEFLPPDLTFQCEDQKQQIADYIKDFYFGNLPINANTTLAYINYITDVMFVAPALRSVSLNIAGGNKQIYLYLYKYVDDNEPYVPYSTLRGAKHCAQSLTIFDDMKPKNVSVKLDLLRKIMREMWSNFITTGEPIPKGSFLNLKWPPTRVDRSPYMCLGQVVKLDAKLLDDRASFWDAIYERFYRQPLPPPIPPIIKLDVGIMYETET